MDLKKTGSYYTPNSLVRAMIDYINIDRETTVLEPSAGDGRIVKEINDNCRFKELDAIEVIKEKADSLKKSLEEIDSIYIFNEDFLNYSSRISKKYDLIIGNPPYINKKNLTKDQIELSETLYKDFNLKPKSFKNLWAAFVLASIKILKESGVIFFVLPYEFLQVYHSVAIRNLLENRYNNIKIFVFTNKIFTNIQQDVCLLYLSNTENVPYIEYNLIDKFNLKKPISSNKIFKNKPLEKWTNSIVSDLEIELLRKLSQKCVNVGKIGVMSPGVVTGSNDYFILSNEFIRKKRIKRYVEPIISKSAYLKNIFILDKEALDMISQKFEKVNLMKLNNYKEYKLPKAIKEYINLGKEQKINERYKCKIRTPWYNLPNDLIGDIVFFKRYDIIPRIIVNDVKCHTTDIGYNIKLEDSYEAKSVAFCFYNSFTLCLCEYHGRFYGGGVAELTPNELRKIFIPYKKISLNHIETFNQMIKENIDIEILIDYVDEIVLDGLVTKNEICILKKIRTRYLNRRRM